MRFGKRSHAVHCFCDNARFSDLIAGFLNLQATSDTGLPSSDLSFDLRPLSLALLVLPVHSAVRGDAVYVPVSFGAAATDGALSDLDLTSEPSSQKR